MPAESATRLRHPGPTGLRKRQLGTEERPAGEPRRPIATTRSLDPLHVLRHKIKRFLHFLFGERGYTAGCRDTAVPPGCSLHAQKQKGGLVKEETSPELGIS